MLLFLVSILFSLLSIRVMFFERFTSINCTTKHGLIGFVRVAGPPLLNGRCTSLLRVIVSEMTYTVLSGTLNSTIPYHTIPRHVQLDTADRRQCSVHASSGEEVQGRRDDGSCADTSHEQKDNYSDTP